MFKNRSEYIDALLSCAKVKCHSLDSYKNPAKHINKISQRKFTCFGDELVPKCYFSMSFHGNKNIFRII